MIKESLSNIIKQGEGDRIEFKSAFNKELIETIVAFANSKGGSIFIGVSEKGKTVGVSINDESIQNWINEIKTKTSPEIIPDVEIYSVENKTIVELIVKEYPIKPVATQGRYFKRAKNSNHLMSVDEVSNMHLQTINSSWDAYPDPLHSVKDISIEKVKKAISELKRKGKFVDDDTNVFLSKYNLIRDNKLTFGGYLMFKKEDCFLSTIELGRFQDNITIKDSDRTKSDLITQVDDVFNFVKKHINKAVIITGQAQNTEKWDYPLEAIREIIMNMIVHRDYRSSADSIVKIYNNKIEFFNPGRLPENITVDDLLSNNYKSSPRNKLIADLFKDLGHIEKYGSGIQRIINLFKKEKLQIPEFTNISNGFMVTVFADNVDDNLNDDTLNVPKNVPNNVPENVPKKRMATIITWIKSNEQISMLELAKKIGVNHKTIKRDIQQLKAVGILKRVGPAKGGHWQIIDDK